MTAFICGTCMRVVSGGFSWHCGRGDGCGGHHALTVAQCPLTGRERPRAAVFKDAVEISRKVGRPRKSRRAQSGWLVS